MAWSSRLRKVVLAGGLLLLCVGLAAAIAGQLRHGGRPGDAAAAAAADGESLAPKMPDFALPPFEDFAELVERPLFSSTRRPIEAGDEPERVSAAPQGLDVALTGVIIADGNKVALIVPRNTSKPVRLLEGQRFQGWTLSEVEPEGVIFRQGTQAKILELDRKSGGTFAKND